MKGIPLTKGDAPASPTSPAQAGGDSSADERAVHAGWNCWQKFCWKGWFFMLGWGCWQHGCLCIEVPLSSCSPRGASRRWLAARRTLLPCKALVLSLPCQHSAPRRTRNLQRPPGKRSWIPLWSLAARTASRAQQRWRWRCRRPRWPARVALPKARLWQRPSYPAGRG